MAKSQKVVRRALFLRKLLDIVSSIAFWRRVWETGI